MPSLTEENPRQQEPAKPVVSSSTAGFFQEAPRVPSQFDEDTAYKRVLELFLPHDIRAKVTPDLARFAALCVTPQIRKNTINAEANLPYVRTWDTFGRRRDELVTSEGWRISTALAAKEGIVAIGYNTDKWGQHARTYQFLKTHLWGTNSCGVTCPGAMQDGAAALLSRHVQPNSDTPEETRVVFREALRRLLSRDPQESWTSGQWMTERPGGSDVRNTETRATFAPDMPSTMPAVGSDGSPLGPWRIDGFKWFSSATDANMSVLLAKTGATDEISAFYAPTRRRIRDPMASGASQEENTESNGIQIQRLKNKLGTKPLPTAELVLQGMRAHLIGQVGRGTKEISSILNITRIHTAVGAVGGWGRGLAISRAFSRVRKTSGSLLMDVPAHVKGLAEQHVDYRAYMLLTYFVVSLLGTVETGTQALDVGPLTPSPETAAQLLRLLTPVLKSQSSLAAIAGLRFCMESLGGVGYLENEDPELNIARIFRDTNVLSIWEGTTDVLASDTMRVVKAKRGVDALGVLGDWFMDALARWKNRNDLSQMASSGLFDLIEQGWKDLRAMVSGNDSAALLYHGREVMQRIATIVCSVLLIEDALRDGNEVALEIAKRWIAKRSQSDRVDSSRLKSWNKEAAWDREIVFGHDSSVHEISRL